MLARPPGSRFVHEPDNGNQDLFAARSLAGIGEFPTTFRRTRDEQRLWDTAFGHRPPASFARRRIGRIANRLFLKMDLVDRWQLQRGTATRTAKAQARTLSLAAVPLRAAGDQRPVVKSVYSIWVAEKIVKRYDPHVVLVRRDRLEASASWHQLKFGDFPFHEVQAVRRELLEPHGIAPLKNNASPASRAAWTYSVLDLMCSDLAARNPDWKTVWHDRLVDDPVGGFKDLYRFTEAEVADHELRQWIDDGNQAGDTYEVKRELTTVREQAQDRLPPGELADMKATIAMFTDL